MDGVSGHLVQTRLDPNRYRYGLGFVAAAAMEVSAGGGCFFSRLKLERIYRKKYVSREELRADVFDYIEMFYNPRRRHSTLGQISPVEFERRYSAQAKCP